MMIKTKQQFNDDNNALRAKMKGLKITFITYEEYLKRNKDEQNGDL